MSHLNATVLIVDDQEASRLLLSKALEQRGCDVLIAQDGNIALRVLARASVDLILLDICMPGFNGLELLRAIRKNAATALLPVIMVSSFDNSEKMLEAFELGANDYITKPFMLPLLLARVQTQLRMQQERRPKPPPIPKQKTLKANEPGSILAGQYRLEAQIGEGGFGAVFRAVRLSDNMPVAVKILQTAILPTEEARTRFEIEGITTRRIQHPNAVVVLDSGVTVEGLAFLVMELLTGTPLDKLIRHGPLSTKRAAEILLPVCDVLISAHRAKIIHRDLKPSNIFLQQTADGYLTKVLDFGLAKILDENFGDDLTQENQILGSFSYVAPERLRGEKYDGRSDIYSLGAMLYELTVGSPPFISPTSNPTVVAIMHLNETPTSPRAQQPQMSQDLDALILAMLDKNPKCRPSLVEIIYRLKPVAAGEELEPAVRKRANFAGKTMVLTEVFGDTPAQDAALQKPAEVPVTSGESSVIELGESSIISTSDCVPPFDRPAHGSKEAATTKLDLTKPPELPRHNHPRAVAKLTLPDDDDTTIIKTR